MLGDGIPLFAPGLPGLDFALMRTEGFATGLVQSSYRRAR